MSLFAEESGVHGDEVKPAVLPPCEELFEKHRKRNYLGFLLLGIIINFHYCLAISAADDLATDYGMKKYVAVIGFANVVFGLVSRILNTFICNKTPYNIRVSVMCGLILVGIILVSFSRQIGGGGVGSFVVVIIGVCFSGGSSRYGESVILGYLEGYPEKLVAAWASGSGLSAFAGPIFYIGLIAAKLSPPHVFLISIPFLFVFYGSFMFVLVYPKMKETATIAGNQIGGATTEGAEGHRAAMLGLERAVLEDDDIANYQMVTNFFHSPWWWPKEAKEVDSSDQFSEREPAPRGVNRALANVDGSLPPMVYPERSWRAEAATSCCPPVKRTALSLKQWWTENGGEIRKVLSVTVWYNFNLGVVYGFDYVIQFLFPFSLPCHATDKPGNFFLVNAFAISQCCFQFGELVSRNLFFFVKFRWVGVLSIIQTCNGIVWLVQANTLFMSSADEHKELKFAFGLFALIFFTGVVGGTSYANVFYLILRRTKKLERAEEMDVTAAYKDEKQRLVAGAVEDDGDYEKEGANLNPERTPGAPVAAAQSDYPRAPSAIFNVAGQDEEAEDTRAIDLLRGHVAELWRRRREFSMSLAALCASVGITTGTILDVILTATMKQNC